MKNFEKFQLINNFKQINQNSIDIIEIQTQNPELFSNLTKTSTCYLEADVFYNYINEDFTASQQQNLNQIFSPQKNQFSPIKFKQNIINQDNQDNNNNYENNKFAEVKLTRSLFKFWEEEAIRRKQLGIKNKVELQISWEKNIESTLDYKLGQIDNLYLTDAKYDKDQKLFNKFLKQIENYKESLTQKPTHFKPTYVFADDTRIVQFFNNDKFYKQQNLEAQIARYKQYETNKKEILAMLYDYNNENDVVTSNNKKQKQNILQNYENQTELDEEEEFKNIQNNKKKKQDEKQDIFQILFKNANKKYKGDRFWRNNYKSNKQNVLNLKNTPFSVCKYCQQTYQTCICQQQQDYYQQINENSNSNNNNTFLQVNSNQYPVIGSQQSLITTPENSQFFNDTENNNNLQIDQQKYQEQLQDRQKLIKNSKNNQLFIKYHKKPPKFKQIQKDLQNNQMWHIHQYPYFENCNDLLQHYDIKNKKINMSSQNAQLFVKDFIKIPDNKFYSVQIKEDQKVPEFTRMYLNNSYDVNNNNILQNQNDKQLFQKKQIFQFNKKCPNFIDIYNQHKRNTVKEEKNINQTNTQNYKNLQEQKVKISLETCDQIIPNLTILYFEVFATASKQGFQSNPDYDKVQVLGLTLVNQNVQYKYEKLNPNEKFSPPQILIIVDNINFKDLKQNKIQLKSYYKIDTNVNDIIIVKDEISLIYVFIMLNFKFDPDCIGGYDIEKKSLYYLASRAWLYGINLTDVLGRSPSNFDELFDFIMFKDFISMENSIEYENFQNNFFYKFENTQKTLSKQQQNIQNSIKQQMNIAINQYPNTKTFKLNINVNGRVMLNLWRFAKRDLKLNNYDIENIYHHFYKIRLPVFDTIQLNKFYENQNTQHIVLNYILKRLKCCDSITNKLSLVSNSTEMSRLYGCEFESTLTRGTQYRIESVLCKITKRQDYLLMSPSKIQVAHQKILQCVPMVLEPPKRFYVDPVLVLDFQSLYPSVMISHNICYTTCLGHVDDIFKPEGKKRLGVKVDVPIYLKELFDGNTEQQIKDKIFISPNGVVFLRKHVKQGILPLVLEEFLNTRIMIKNSMHLYDDKILLQMFNFRQFYLKYFMNFTYGYTGASLSGRMPCADIADTIVEVSKCCLKQTIKSINQNKEWQAEVVYGDTDSVFVHLKGRSQQQAFDIGKEMVKEITKEYPYPMELKFENIMMPCILASKKRYVGYKYDFVGDTPKFQSKGVEIIRRDGCGAQAKIQRNALNLIFQNKNITQLKQYLQKEYAKISNNHLNLIDYIVAKEVKLGSYISFLPANAVVGEKLGKKDPVLMPKYEERVKYIIQNGADIDKIKDLAIDIKSFVENSEKDLNVNYYIKRMVNSSLHRLFTTFDIDVNDWYESMPKGLSKENPVHSKSLVIQGSQKKTQHQKILQNYSLNKFYHKQICILCSKKSLNQICSQCLDNPIATSFILREKLNFIELKQAELENYCKSCSQLNYYDIQSVPCSEYNCKHLFEKVKNQDKIKQTKHLILKFEKVIQNSINNL